MKLKELFLSLSKNKQIVEIYCNEDNRESIFGFKINHIDSEELEFDEVIDAIIDEINRAFIENTNLIENMEGTTGDLNEEMHVILYEITNVEQTGKTVPIYSVYTTDEESITGKQETLVYAQHPTVGELYKLAKIIQPNKEENS